MNKRPWFPVYVLLCGFPLVGAAHAGTISIDLYSDATCSLDDSTWDCPGPLLAHVSTLNDSSLIPGDNIYTFSPAGIALTDDTIYWIGLSSFDGSVAQWDYQADDSGLYVTGYGYYSNALGYSDNSTGAYLMTIFDTSYGDEFDSINPLYGGGTIIDSDGIVNGPLYASWATSGGSIPSYPSDASDPPGNLLSSVSVELYDPASAPVPEPSSALLIGVGLVGLLAWRLRSPAARRALAAVLPLAAGLALWVPAWAQTPAAIHRSSDEEVNAARGYWTPERMATAIPMPMPMSTGSPSLSTRLLRPEGTTSSTAPGFDPAGAPVGVNRSGVLRPHSPVIPAAVGNCTDCTNNGTCIPYNSTFIVSPDLYNSNQSNLPYRAVGKVFFTMDGFNYVCSGSSIGGSAVLTAGHCVSDGNGNYVTNWVFVPEFYNFTSPLPFPWVATQLLTFPEFLNGGDLGRDVGFAVVKGLQNGVAISASLSDSVGHLGFAWNQNPTALNWSAFGYPIIYYTGLEMIQTVATTACRNPLQTPASVGIGSYLKSGASGGPWVLDFLPTLTDLNLNYVGGLNSYITPSGQQVYTPYFDQAVKDLKDQAVAAKP